VGATLGLLDLSSLLSHSSPGLARMRLLFTSNM
jgi:hypothetical protein